MFRLIVILLAVAAVVSMVRCLKGQKRLKQIDEMTEEELVDAVIRREISILEVPREHRDSVKETLEEIQSELDKTQ